LLNYFVVSFLLRRNHVSLHTGNCVSNHISGYAKSTVATSSTNCSSAHGRWKWACVRFFLIKIVIIIKKTVELSDYLRSPLDHTGSMSLLLYLRLFLNVTKNYVQCIDSIFCVYLDCFLLIFFCKYFYLSTNIVRDHTYLNFIHELERHYKYYCGYGYYIVLVWMVQ
jgi:hypothetical protein